MRFFNRSVYPPSQINFHQIIKTLSFGHGSARLQYNKGMNFSVLIGTIGRASLVPLCESILDDAKDAGIPVTIYVALNGELDAVLDTSDGRIRVIEVSNKPCGLGFSSNAAIRSIPEGWTWTIADDDFWQEGKFIHDISVLNTVSFDQDLILLPRVEYLGRRSRRVRPTKIYRKEESVLDYLYGHLAFILNPRYMTMSGSVAQTRVWQAYPFGLGACREDVDQLISMEAGGVSIRQSSNVTIIIDATTSRSSDRDPPQAAVHWALKQLSGIQVFWFLGTRWPKPFVWDGRATDILDMLNVLRKERSMSWYSKILLFPVLSLAYVMATFRSISFCR